MESWNWSGNIRELENRIRRACIMADGQVLSARDLELDIGGDDAPLNLKEVRSGAERQAILRALNRCAHNISQTARVLGVSRPTLYNLLSKHGIAVENNHE